MGKEVGINNEGGYHEFNYRGKNNKTDQKNYKNQYTDKARNFNKN